MWGFEDSHEQQAQYPEESQEAAEWLDWEEMVAEAWNKTGESK